MDENIYTNFLKLNFKSKTPQSKLEIIKTPHSII